MRLDLKQNALHTLHHAIEHLSWADASTDTAEGRTFREESFEVEKQDDNGKKCLWSPVFTRPPRPERFAVSPGSASKVVGEDYDHVARRGGRVAAAGGATTRPPPQWRARAPARRRQAGRGGLGRGTYPSRRTLSQTVVRWEGDGARSSPYRPAACPLAGSPRPGADSRPRQRRRAASGHRGRRRARQRARELLSHQA